jgi:hypothetical protein
MRAAALVVLVAASTAHAEPGAVLYATKGMLYQRTEAGVVTEIASLPSELGTLKWIEATPSGRLVVLDFGEKQAWLVPADSASGWMLRTGACTGRARPSPTEECVICPSGDGVIMQAATTDVTIPLPFGLTDIAFRGSSGLDLVGLMDGHVLGVDRRWPRVADLLAGEAPRSHLLVSPDGRHAIAVFGEGDASRFRTFLLDGVGVARQLGGPGVPIGWSPDSQWVLAQEGILDGEEEGDDDDGGEGAVWQGGGPLLGFPGELAAAPKPKRRPPPRRRKGSRPPVILADAARTRACVARAIGGEVKCWPDFDGMAMSPDSMRVLLKKGDTLYIGDVAGVRPTPPKKLIDGVDGPATWLQN